LNRSLARSISAIHHRERVNEVQWPSLHGFINRAQRSSALERVVNESGRWSGRRTSQLPGKFRKMPLDMLRRKSLIWKVNRWKECVPNLFKDRYSHEQGRIRIPYTIIRGLK
jgi:hypothetical protein